MADEKTDQISTRDILEMLLERIDRLGVEQRAMEDRLDARLAKVEAFVGERIYDTRPKLDLLLKEVADTKQEVASVKQDVGDLKQQLLRINNQIRLFSEDIWGEREKRAGLEYRVEQLERKAA